MGTNIKKELVLEGLCCANCAAKIERKVNELENIDTASMNFMTKTLVLETKDPDKIEKLTEQVKAIVKSIEPDVVVRERLITKGDKKVIMLLGLSCANCAAKIETKIKNIAGVGSASLDLVSQRLILEVHNHIEFGKIYEEIEAIVKAIEPDVKITIHGRDQRNEDTSPARSILANADIKDLYKIAASSLLLGVAVIFNFPQLIEFTLFLISYIIVGSEVLIKALRNILKGQVFDENFLMGIATIGAFAIGEFPEGVAVMLFYQIGEYIQDIAVNRSRKSISSLMDIRPDYANLKSENGLQKVSPDDVRVGDIIVVKPGEKIPLDGRIIEGKSMVDTSALTGESVPKEVEAGNGILSGFININGLLSIEVTKEFGESTVSRILDLVQNASSRKAPTENFITKFARYYTPAVVIIAVLLAVLPPLFIEGAAFSTWIYRALVFLVISCPCALVISIPLGFFAGIGGASKKGILVKGSNYLEALNNVDTVVFDKTGTLTKGVFKVSEIMSRNGFKESELLEYAAYAEGYSNHPIASSILKAYGRDINKDEIKKHDELSGQGIKVRAKGHDILAGNEKLMLKENISYDTIESAGTTVHVAVDGKYAGYIVISDELKSDSKAAIAALKNMGIRKTVMLTGDNRSIAKKISNELSVDEFYAELLPDNKVEKIEELEKDKGKGRKILFVGDGINDAPVLARADVGVAMGGLGSDAAIEAADIVIMTDEPSKLVTGIRIAKRTRIIIWQNIIFAMGIKLLVLVLGAGGLATIWEAVFADVGVTVIAVLNSMRVLNVKGIE